MLQVLSHRIKVPTEHAKLITAFADRFRNANIKIPASKRDGSVPKFTHWSRYGGRQEEGHDAAYQQRNSEQQPAGISRGPDRMRGARWSNKKCVYAAVYGDQLRLRTRTPQIARIAIIELMPAQVFAMPAENPG